MKSWTWKYFQHAWNSSPNSTLGFLSTLFVKCQAGFDILDGLLLKKRTGEKSNQHSTAEISAVERHLLWLLDFRGSRWSSGRYVCQTLFKKILPAKCPLKLTL